MGREKEKKGRGNKTKGKVKGGEEGKKAEGRKKGIGKGRRKERGTGRERWYPTFWYKVTPMSASDIHTRRIGLATRNQSAIFMMSIN